jgi:hypothetical protein
MKTDYSLYPTYYEIINVKSSYFWYIFILLPNCHDSLNLKNFIHGNRTILFKVAWFVYPQILVDSSFIILYNDLPYHKTCHVSPLNFSA